MQSAATLVSAKLHSSCKPLIFTCSWRTPPALYIAAFALPRAASSTLGTGSPLSWANLMRLIPCDSRGSVLAVETGAAVGGLFDDAATCDIAGFAGKAALGRYPGCSICVIAAIFTSSGILREGFACTTEATIWGNHQDTLERREGDPTQHRIDSKQLRWCDAKVECPSHDEICESVRNRPGVLTEDIHLALLSAALFFWDTTKPLAPKAVPFATGEAPCLGGAPNSMQYTDTFASEEVARRIEYKGHIHGSMVKLQQRSTRRYVYKSQ